MFCKLTGWCKKTLPLFEFPALAAAWQTDQPMHSQSANFGKFKLNSLNLVAFLFAPPCTFYVCSDQAGDYWVIDTDYDTFASVYSCADLGPIKFELAYILTREKNPSEETVLTFYFMNKLVNFNVG